MDKYIFTIGHGGRNINNFFQLINQYGIQFLVDVRSYPYSKYYSHFNRENLEVISKKYNIKYLFMGDTLGGRPKDPSCYSDNKDEEGKSQVLYDRIKEKEFFINSIKRLVTANQKRIKIACMCSELNPCDCHRTKLIGEVLYHNERIMSYHIDEKGNVKTQSEVINEITRGRSTPSLFGEEIGFESKGKY